MHQWLLVVLLVGMTACSSVPTRPAAGQEIRLSAKEGNEWYLADDAFSQDAYAKALAAKDTIGIQDLIRRERIFPVANGTRLLVLEQGWTAMRVRVLEGPQYGKAGWIAFEHVR
jgi:hypothetical protein